VRDGTQMMLYVSVVLIAELAALPSKDDSGGIAGWELLAIVWGTAIGLALAHWFAFTVASAVASDDGRVTRDDVWLMGAQVAGATIVALVDTIPVLLFSAEGEVRVAIFGPAILIGFAGYHISRQSSRSRVAAITFGGIVLVVGLTVAALKNLLHH